MAKKILIVDDDPVIVKFFEKLLMDNGYETLTAMDSDTCMDLVQKDQPDLILLDVMMERLYSGFEIYRKLKLDEKLSKIPIIGISGMADEIDVKFDKYRDAEYFNPDEFIDKPVDQDFLLKKVGEVLGSAVGC